MAEEKTKEVLELHVPTTLKNLIEALVFAAKEPLTFRQMKDIYEGEGPQAYLRQLDPDEVEAAINELNGEYERAEKAYRIVRIAGGFQFATMSAYADWIGRLYKEQGRRKLSQTGIESLAIIAYKQPVTKADIESIRGVNCDYVLKTLLEKELVTVVGRAHAPGRPLLYGTTREFLKHFGLNEVTDLPRPREIEEILGESQFETERRMLEAQAGAEKIKEEEPDFKSRLPHIPKKKPELDGTVEIKPKVSTRELKTVNHVEVEKEPDNESPVEEDSAISGRDDALELLEKPGVVEPSHDLNRSLSVPTPGVEPRDGNVEPQDASTGKEEHEPIEASQVAALMVGAPNLPPEDVQQDEADPSVPSFEPVVKLEDGDRDLKHGAGWQGSAFEETLSRTSGNKSRWQTWKERVQGFIRKIFG